MPEVSTTVTVDRSADDVWDVVRDVGALDGWMPMVEACELDGDSRTVTLAGGLGTLVEKILSVEDDDRTLTYTITDGPMAFERYLATWTVVPAGDGADVTWKVDIEPEDFVDLMKGTQEATLAGLKEHLEA